MHREYTQSELQEKYKRFLKHRHRSTGPKTTMKCSLKSPETKTPGVMKLSDNHEGKMDPNSTGKNFPRRSPFSGKFEMVSKEREESIRYKNKQLNSFVEEYSQMGGSKLNELLDDDEKPNIHHNLESRLDEVKNNSVEFSKCSEMNFQPMRKKFRDVKLHKKNYISFAESRSLFQSSPANTQLLSNPACKNALLAKTKNFDLLTSMFKKNSHPKPEHSLSESPPPVGVTPTFEEFEAG